MKTHQEPTKSFPVVRHKKPNTRTRKRTSNASQLPTWWTEHPFGGGITNVLRAYSTVYAVKSCFPGVNPRFCVICDKKERFFLKFPKGCTHALQVTTLSGSTRLKTKTGDWRRAFIASKSSFVLKISLGWRPPALSCRWLLRQSTVTIHPTRRWALAPSPFKKATPN